jgi:3-dehydroquinate dehydratase type I
MTVSSMSTKSTHGQMSYVSSVTGGSSIPIYLASTQEDFPSQPYAQTPTPRSTRTFARNASIVLIGIRGTGKTSLALIASTAISRKVVESDRFFHHITGMTRGEHRKRFGPVKHHQAQLEILTKVLKTYDEGYIIVCSVGLVEKSGQALLKEYSKTHPIVHITRDAESLQEYLKTWDRERLNSLLGLSGSFFRSCSNYEFYNLTHRVESPSPMGVQGDEIDDDEVTPGQKSLAPFLTLKKAEDEFSNFLGVILGGVHSSLDSKYPLSRVPTEKKSYTYMVSVQLLALLDRSADIQEIETGADAIEIVVDLSSLSKTDDLNPHVADSISRAVSLVRRNTIVPIVYTVIPESCRHGSDWDDASRSRYLELLHHGLRLAPEYITVDLSLNRTVADILRAKGSTNVIGYYAFASRPSMGWDSPLCTEMYDRANNMGCQVARICMASESSRDIFATEAFRSKILASPGARIPLIAYEIGEQGKTSSCFNQILTPVLPRSLALAQRRYASEESAAAIYDYMPCLTSQEATRALYACFILDPMRFYNFGASITYSLSPAMHNAAYQVLGMPHTYQIYQATSLDELEGLVRQADFGGAAISLPWKVDVIPRLHSLSRNAKAIGAVNTVIPIRFLPLDDDVVPDQLQLLSERNRAGPVKALHGDNTVSSPFSSAFWYN